MNTRLIGLALSGALLLAACGGTTPPPKDTTAPTLTLTNAQQVAPGVTSVTVTGKVSDDQPVSELVAVYSVDGGVPQPVTIQADGGFSFSVPLPAGKSGTLIVVAVTDRAGNATTANETITRAQVQPEPTVTFSGSVVVQRAGEAVAGATVRVEGKNAQTTTDAVGRFAFKVPVSAKVLLIEKAGYGTVRVENIDTSNPQPLEEIMPRLFDLSLPSVAPTVKLEVQTNPQEPDPTKAKFADFGDGATIGDQNLILRATVTTASPAVNPPDSGIASVGSSAGNSGYLNAGRVRSVTSVADGTGLFAFAKSSFAAFSGTVEVHVNIFDFNGNHTDVIRRVKVGSAASAAAVAAPTKVAPTAITFADTATFGALSKNPGAAGLLRQYLSTQDAKALNALRPGAGQVTAQGEGVRPDAASQGTVLWVDVGFTYDPGATAPRAFELYRSLDGQTYNKVLTAAPARVKVPVPTGQPDQGLYTIRDTSSLLTPGVKTYYKVRAVGDGNTQDSGVQNVTPLGRYRVELVAPGQAATGVDRIPVFRWRTFGASSQELLKVVVFDRTEAEGKTTQYISDPVQGNALIYNADGLARTPHLQAYHAYDWQLAAVTANADGTAFSIAADFFNLFQITAFPVEGGPVNEFVTGGL